MNNRKEPPYVEEKCYTEQQKVKILREHLKNEVPVSELCKRYAIQPKVFYLWKKQLFEGALETFSGIHRLATVRMAEPSKGWKVEESYDKLKGTYARLFYTHARYYWGRRKMWFGHP